MNPFDLLKNMDQIKKQAEDMQSKMATLHCTGYACGNLIEAVANGNMEIETLKIDSSLLKEENKEMVEVLVISAINTAIKNVQERIKTETSSLMSKYGVNP